MTNGATAVVGLVNAGSSSVLIREYMIYIAVELETKHDLDSVQLIKLGATNCILKFKEYLSIK